MRSKIGLGVLLLGMAAAFAADNYTQWPFYKVITLNTTSSTGGANLVNTVTSFPMLVRLTSANFTGNFTTPGAKSSLRFSRGAAHLPYEVERWDSTGGNAAEVWVLMDTVFANSSSETFTMYWGKSGAPDSSDMAAGYAGGAVFAASNGFIGAWHLGNAAGVSPRPNSVPGSPAATPSNDAAAFGGGVGTYVAPLGIIGYAETLRGGGTNGAPAATSDYIDIGNVPSANTFPGYTSFSNGFTYSVWVNPSTPTAAYSYLLELCNGGGSPANNMQIFRPTATTNTTLRYQVTQGATAGTLPTSANGAFVNGSWEQLVVTVGTGATPTVLMYHNGATIAVTPTTSNYPADSVVRSSNWIGKSNYASDPYFVGMIDEPEISGVVRSADWVNLSYKTQAAASAVLTLGATASPAPTSLTYSPNAPIYTVGFAIPNNYPTVSPGAATHFSVSPPLPNGLSLDTVLGVISGTPSLPTATAKYAVTASNTAGSTVDSISITVNSALVAPSALSYSTNPATYGVGTAIASNTPTVTGTVTHYAVSPALPAGLHIDSVAGVISGTPTSPISAANYTVTASNTAGNTTAAVNITVVAAPSALSYTKDTTNYPVGAVIAANSPTVTGTVTSYSVSPALPGGLTLNTTTGVITGTPTTVLSPASYVVTATNLAGSTTVTLNIAVYGPPSNLFYFSDPISYSVGTAITPNTAYITGTVTHYSISPALPAGLVIDSVAGTISGTPTAVTASTNYTVTASSPAGSTTVLLTITTTPSGIAGAIAREIPLLQISQSSLSFHMPDGASELGVSIVDMAGRTVWARTLEAGNMGGAGEFTWKGETSTGGRTSAGLYVVRVNIFNANQQVTGSVEKRVNYTP